MDEEEEMDEVEAQEITDNYMKLMNSAWDDPEEVDKELDE